jgi:MFS family permease
MVVFCGVVGNFTQLLLVRVGVAVGEAGCLPTAQSLIADYFDRAERPHAMAIYALGGPLAVVIGYLGGGWLIEHYGWRITFMVIGVPGVLLALLVKFTLREPRLRHKNRALKPPPSFKVVLTTLWQQRTFRTIAIAFSVSSFFSMGLLQWLPTFFMRSYGMGVGELGAWFALVWGGCGLFGTYLGGVLATRYVAHREALQMQACAFLFGSGGLLYILVFLSSDEYHAIAYMAVAGTVMPMCSGIIFSAIQSLVNDHMRSMALAVIFLLANLIGFGLGPFAVGLLSDQLAQTFGQESLRYALAAFSPGFLWVGFYYWKAASTIEADIRCVESDGDSLEANVDTSSQYNLTNNKPINVASNDVVTGKSYE